jgi:nicotinamidase-related amidase
MVELMRDPLPLDDVRVVEQGQLLAGSFCGQLLGDFGAEVIKVEDPKHGDPMRQCAFFGTTLASTLPAQGVDTVVLVGVSTSGCVRASAVDAIQHGFVPLVVREAVGDRTARTQESNLYDLQAKYAEVISEAETTAYLEGRPR